MLTSKIDTQGPGARGRRLQYAGLATLRHRRGRCRLRRRGRRRRSSSPTPTARPCPTQIVESTRYADGGLRRRASRSSRAMCRRWAMRLITSLPSDRPTASALSGRRDHDPAAGPRSHSRMNTTASPSTARPGRSPACASRTATGRSCPGPATSWRGNKTGATSGNSTRGSTAAAASP